MRSDTAAPAWIDMAVPSPARIYDYYLGGKDNFAADRAAAEKALSVVPQGREVAHSNRQFLVRAVRYMASRGVTQFIDLGTGFPTPPSVHQTAAANLTVRPRVVYIDNDPMVTSHNQALLAGSPLAAITVIHGDIRSPGQLFARQELWNAIDFNQPGGMLFVAVLHFIPDEDDPHDSVRAFCARWHRAASWPCRTSPATARPRKPWPRSATPIGRPAHQRCSAAGPSSRTSSPACRSSIPGSSRYLPGAPERPSPWRYGSWVASG
jgi:hypothetical protein